MAHNSLRRASGTWIGVATPQDFEYFDTAQFKSLNGDDGGTWNPSAWIMLGGNYGLRIGATASFDCQGSGNILGNVTLGSNADNSLSVNALARFYAAAHCNGRLYAHENIVSDGNCQFGTDDNNSFIVYGTGHFYENVTFDKTATFSGNVVLGNAGSDTVTVNAAMTTVGLFTVSGNSSIAAATFTGLVYHQDDVRFTGGTVTFNTPVSLTNPITPGADGYIVKRHYTTTVGETHSIGTMDVVRVAASGTAYVANYGEDGAVIRIINSSSGTLTISTPSDHVLRVLPAHTWIDLMRDSAWGAYGWSSIGEGTYTELT